jgi:protein ImuB
MTLAQARALVPKLAARGRDAVAERAAHEALVEIAARFSPRVEPDRDPSSGLVFLDLQEPERAQATALARAARREGLPAGVGVASSKLAAAVAAGVSTGSASGGAAAEPQVVPDGEEAAFLAPLPLSRLAPELALARTLERWGLASIGDFARLPPAEVSSRLGPEGARLHAIARGIDPRPLLALEPPSDLTEGLDFEWPLVTLEPFLFVARAALDRLTRRLETRALGCARLALELLLDPAGRDARAWDLPAPTRDGKTLLTVVRLDLEGRPPGAPVVGFALTAIPGRVRAEQGALFGPPAISPERLATTLARLFALLGDGRVGSPRPLDGHRPERFALVPFAPPPPPLRPPALSASATHGGVLAVRTLRPPIELEVEVAPRPGDREPAPAVLRTLPREAAAGARRPEICGSVRVASGPWRLEEGWWHGTPDGVAPAAGGRGAASATDPVPERAVEREYWDIELVPAGLYRIYREPAADRWFADGVYD